MEHFRNYIISYGSQYLPISNRGGLACHYRE